MIVHLYTAILYYMHYMRVISFVPKSMSYTYQYICTINLYIYSTKTTTLPQGKPWVWQGRRRAYRPPCPPNRRGRQAIVHNIIYTYFEYIHVYYIYYILQYTYIYNHSISIQGESPCIITPIFFLWQRNLLKFWVWNFKIYTHKDHILKYLDFSYTI